MFHYKHRHLEITSIFIFVVYCIMLLVKIGEETFRLADNLSYLVIPLALAPLFVGCRGGFFSSFAQVVKQRYKYQRKQNNE